MNRYTLLSLLAGLAASVVASDAHAQATPGAQAFGQCAACHSLAPGRHFTGPSLAGVLDRAAGDAPGFGRYSDALTGSGLTWDRDTLDRWLADPQALVPGTSMRIRPIDDPATRAALVEFLAAAGAGVDAPVSDASGHAGMMHGMGAGGMRNLKEAKPNQRVSAITYCPDAYRVTFENGSSYTFWEFNLRFKTDSSPEGPTPGAPVVVPQGMMGDRAQVVFARPSEIGAFVRDECPKE